MKKWLVWIFIVCASLSPCHAESDYFQIQEYCGGWAWNELSDLYRAQQYYANSREAGDQWYESDWLPYDETDRPFDGAICWALDRQTVEEETGEERFTHVLRKIDLETGDTDEDSLESGYIIQKDPAEFDGVLYAIEADGTVEIWHRRPDGEAEFIRGCSISAPYYGFTWEMGVQTVRAYMHGALYYVQVLKDEGLQPTEIQHSRRLEDGSFLTETRPSYALGERKAALCRLGEDGETYRYALNDYEKNEYGCVNSLIDCYAIAPDGALAWTSGETYESNADARAADDLSRELWIDIPGEGARRILSRGDLRALDCDAIDGRFLCWLDADTLLFAMYFEPYDCHQLYTINIHTKQCSPCLDREGEPILLWHHVALGSEVAYSARQNAVAYIGLPCPFTATVITDADEALVAVPQIIDLGTGETYVLYENATGFSGELLEYRNRPGQLTWAGE